ncbi:hypothetical protein BD410DRAFT_784900 [Rickenella mellea]|uniref:F-box domain-containing protein n=1 Tax=Rickenella mellea TaxID=50990 RepID=A0A4Y7QEN4_9AGAM|nr:hypothetical protein BD410DRAFT_784900 [Rickenella mellea]
MRILDLPEENILQILFLLAINDIFSLRATCRRLHRITDSDYFWREVYPRSDLPLTISPSLDPRKLSGDEIRRTFTKALRLDSNWSLRTTAIRVVCTLVKEKSDRSYDELRFLPGGTLLVAARRNQSAERSTVSFSVFSIVDMTDPYKIASTEFEGHLNEFSVTLVDEDRKVVIATTLNNSIDGKQWLEVHHTSIPDAPPSAHVSNNHFDTPFRWAAEDVAFLHKVAVNGEIVAASIRWGHDSSVERIHKFLIANWRTGYTCAVIPQNFPIFSSVDIKLFPFHFVTIVASDDELVVLKAELDERLFNGPEHPFIGASDGASPGPDMQLRTWAEYQLAKKDLIISDSTNIGEHQPPRSLSFIAFSTGHIWNTKWEGIRLSIPNCDAQSSANPVVEVSKPFYVLESCYPEHVCLGTTGRRAVWLEREIDTGDARLMKMSYDKSRNVGPTVGVLLSSAPLLPFRPNLVRTLAFDEATGRVALALITSAIYVLDCA